ncbi:DUF3857 domain-containing protein [Sphingobacteriales bacterium UPWRP_1]|nr:hypothetical protein BVG80_08690 [Sphingobacteriales bacterium TSM_CSM]PSJ78502.1 DUF3857 domain-containing protein [Sphingobacteriales bacterium UPWRP_1]
MKNALVLFTCITIMTSVSAQNNNYHVGLIPDSLLENANAVYRISNTSYTRKSVSALREYVHFAVTILNAKGDKHAAFAGFYDNFITISDFTGTIFNENGVKIREIKPKDLLDEPAYPSFTLYSDNRVKYITPKIATYPYTVEYSYVVTYKGFVGIQPWRPLPDYHISVMQATLSYTTPSVIGINYKMLNGQLSFSEKTENNLLTYEWHAENLKAIADEPVSPPFTELFPAILLSPANFEYDNTFGDFSTWESYGNWSYSLISKQDKLPENVVTFIKQLIAPLSSKKEIAKQIYQYMQSKTRYVNISLGIGGFKPVNAQKVDENGYGDCKALSNYTKSLLKIADIEAYYTEIGNGTYQKIAHADFASAYQSNHVILCVPIDKDTIWLECTNQKIPFGYIGSGNSNRYALAITSTGGHLVKTPVYSAQNNLKTTVASQIILPNGNLSTNASFYYTEMAYEDVFGLINSSKEEQKNYIQKNIPINNLHLDTWKVLDSSNETGIPSGSVQFLATASGYASVTGQRIFVPFNPFNRASNPFGGATKRTSDIWLEYGSMQIDTLYFTIPEGYTPEFIPDALTAKSVLGSYELKSRQDNNRICFVRKFVLNEGRYPAKDYPEIYSFFHHIADFDTKKIILKKLP